MPSLISITFDDGLRCQFEKALPILDQHAMKATFFLTANQDPNHDRWSGHTTDWWKIDWRDEDIRMLRAVVENGHEIGSHTISHHPVTLKLPDQAENEVHNSKKLIEDHLGNYTISSFCYPFYWSHQYLAAAVKHTGYAQARGGGVAPAYVPSASYYPLSMGSSLDKLNVDCRQISPQGENVSGWLRQGCWHVLTYHAIGEDKDGWEPVTVTQFSEQMAQLASYRNSGDVEVVTFKDGAARFNASSN